jgi:hypothetical protein
MIPRTAATALLAMLALAIAAPAASGAEFGIVPGSFVIKTVDGGGAPDNRAGAHPDRLLVDFELTASGTGTAVRDLVIELPPGFGGNPRAVGACPQEDIEEGGCPAQSRIGTFEQLMNGEGFEPLSVFNLDPPPGRFAEFGANFFFKTVFTVALRPGDHGINLEAHELIQLAAEEYHLELWGVPADHQSPAEPPPHLPFLTTPTRCEPLTAVLRTRSWREGAPWLSATADSPPREGCQNLPFEPGMGFELGNPVADAPTGMEATLTFPEYVDPDGVVGSPAKAVDIQLPAGISVSPGGAVGLEACTDAQFGFGVNDEATCPPSSRVGTVAVESPSSAEPFTGTVFVGQERPGERFRLFVEAAGSGAHIKLVGVLHVDPESGQMTASLTDLPEFPLTKLALSIDGGPRGLLATPLSCGPTTATATFRPYSGGPPVQSSAAVDIGADPAGSCAAPFAPEFFAGTTSLRAGQPTSFAMTLRRRDGERLPDRIDVDLPLGLSPAIGEVDLCSDSDAAAGTCPASSMIGTTVAEVGSGPVPAAIEGDVYLTDDYRRAPFGVALVFDGVVGPFDLGKLVLRAAVEIDAGSGRATLKTDALPNAFEGIPLRFQMIGLDLDRKGFLRNPTSCEEKMVMATIHAEGGGTFATSSPFAVNGCDSLGFRPKFSVALEGRSQLRRKGKPDLRFSARLPRKSTNLRTVQVTLPRTLKFSTADLREVCSRRDAENDSCPRGSRIGVSHARTPLSKDEFKGSIYVVQPEGNGSPELWATVKGTGARLDLKTKTSSRRGRAIITLDNLPDLPLSALTMHLFGGDKGVLSLRSGPCAGSRLRHLIASVESTGQNGAFRPARVPVVAKTRCGAAAR